LEGILETVSESGRREKGLGVEDGRRAEDGGEQTRIIIG